MRTTFSCIVTRITYYSLSDGLKEEITLRTNGMHLVFLLHLSNNVTTVRRRKRGGPCLWWDRYSGRNQTANSNSCGRKFSVILNFRGKIRYRQTKKPVTQQTPLSYPTVNQSFKLIFKETRSLPAHKTYNIWGLFTFFLFR